MIEPLYGSNLLDAADRLAKIQMEDVQRRGSLSKSLEDSCSYTLPSGLRFISLNDFRYIPSTGKTKKLESENWYKPIRYENIYYIARPIGIIVVDGDLKLCNLDYLIEKIISLGENVTRILLTRGQLTEMYQNMFFRSYSSPWLYYDPVDEDSFRAGYYMGIEIICTNEKQVNLWIERAKYG